MIKNVGKIDMIIRLIAAVILIVWGILTKTWLGLIALIPLITALIRYCPLYHIFGISTCKKS